MQHTYCIACDTSSSSRPSCITTLLTLEGMVVTCCVIFQCHVNFRPETQTTTVIDCNTDFNPNLDCSLDYNLDYNSDLDNNPD